MFIPEISWPRFIKWSQLLNYSWKWIINPIMIVKNQITFIFIFIFTCEMPWHYDWNYTSNHNIVVNVISILIWIFSITLYTVGEDNTDSLTGWFNSVFDTLLGYYNKYTIHTEKSVVDFFSVHRDISLTFHNNKL